MKHVTTTIAILLACAGLARAGTRADLSGDAVVHFVTTMDMPLMSVGDTGNAADATGYGAVGYEYKIGKFEVTAGQYTEFLNAVAATDTYDLYNLNMDVYYKLDGSGCQIIRTGTSGSYAYTVAADFEDRPVNFVSWADGARFANWLHNGRPTTGVTDLTTTEDGSYYLNGETVNANLGLITREADATCVIPSEDEWYKAAYYNAAGSSYYTYGTGSNTLPSNIAVDPDPGNNANFYDPDTAAGPTLGSPYFRTEAGEFENSDSPYGLFDASGNVREWSDTLNGQYRRASRGGHYNTDYNADVQISSAFRVTGFHTSESFALGFRIANIGDSLTGDFDGDGDVDEDDIDMLCANMGGDLDPYDLNSDGVVDEDDMIYHVENLVEYDTNQDGTPDGNGTYRGDFNLDGVVNATDLQLMKGSFGGAGGYASGNANCDAFINATDLQILKGNFGLSASAAPEPLTIGLLAVGGLAMLRRRNNRK